MSFTIADLKAQNLILFECISGSRAYGLDTPTSDTDIKGVFYLPKERFYSLQSDYIPQVSNETNDIVYYELGRFVELLLQNNPNMMELLATPADKVLYRHPIMDSLKPDWFISKLCEKTFAGFANSQIKKARGLNKKIVNPMEKENICCDNWDSFLTAFDFDFKKVGKYHTVDIEGNNNRFRQRLRRVFRKTSCFSKKLANHFKAFDLLFHYVNYGWV